MSEKFSLRQPDYLDLSSDGWKLQPRDAHGRWSKGSGSSVAFEQTTTSSSITRGTQKVSTRSQSTHVSARELSKGEVRQSLTLDHKSRDLLYESAGLKTRFKESETELIHKWHESHGEDKKAIEAEMLVRQKALAVALSTVREAQTLSEREDKRSRLQKFDDTLGKSKVGRGLLKIRDHILSDRAFDAADKAKEGAAEWGKDWAKHLANSRLTGMVVAASVGLSAHFLGGDTPEAVRAFLENPVAEAGAAAAVGLTLGLALKMIHRGGSKAKEKVAPKVKAVAPKVKQKVEGWKS